MLPPAVRGLWLSFLLFALSPIEAHAHAPPAALGRELVMTVWDTHDGMPQASATSMVQRADGTLWFGTFEGLVRFDGIEMEVFDQARCPELPSNAVVRLLLDHGQRLWIGTDQGVALMTGETIGRAPAPIPAGLIESIVEDDRGRVAISGPERRITLIDGDRSWTLATPGEARDEVLDSVTLVASGSRIFAERGRGLYVLGDDNTWSQLAELEDNVLATGARRAGGIYAATSRGIDAIDPGTRERKRIFSFDEPRDADYGRLDETRDGALWYTSHLFGATRYREGRAPQRFTTAQGFPHDSTRFVFEDEEQTIWIGTDGAGLVGLRPSLFRNYAHEDGLSNNIVRAVLEEGPERWLLATHGGGVVRFDHGLFSGPLRASPNGEKLPWAWALLHARDGAEWIGYYGDGITRLAAGKIERPQFPENMRATVRAFAQDEQGTIWIATESGLFRTRGDGSGPITRVLLASGAREEVLCLLATDEGLLAGTEGQGLWRVTAESVQPMTPPGPGHPITALARDSRGGIWAALEGGQLIRWRDHRAIQLGADDGLPGGRIRAIQDDGRGALWLASNHGVLTFELDKLEQYLRGESKKLTVVKLDAESGLPDRDVTSVVRVSADRADGGDLVFSTLHGLAVLTPAAIEKSSIPPRVVFQALNLFDRTGSARRVSIPWAAHALEVEPGPSRIELRFTSPTFVNPEEVLFELQIDGPTQRSIHALRGRSFELLHPAAGRYRFRLSVTDRFGARSAEPAELELEIAAFFWQTRWFAVATTGAALFLVGGAVALVFRRRLVLAHERIAQAQRLRESEERRQELVETSQSLIWALDVKGRWTMMTRAVEQIYGRRAEEMLGTSFTDASTELDADRDFLARLATSEGSVDHGAVHRRAGGGEVHLRFKAIARRDAAGRAIAYAGTAIDVTEEQRALAERERVQRKMEESQRLESLGLLAGGIAHDFNNLLTTTLLNVDYLESRPDNDADAAEAIAAINSVSQRAAQLCRQMLAYSGRGRYEMKPVDLNALAESTARLVRACASPDVRLEFQLAPQLPPASADAGQIGQVVMNLLLNGAEAIGARPGRVFTRTFAAEANAALFADAVVQPKRAEGLFAVLSVEDDGCGMSAETLGRIFDPFFTTKSTGRGLGLAAVLGIVRGHGGALSVKSTEGKGSTFEVWLPAQAAAEREVAVSAQPRARAPVSQVALIADDEAPIRSALARILSRRGVSVVQCENGREAVERFEPGRFHLVYLDVTMPVMSGLEALQAILARAPSQRVVLMSGYDAPDAGAHPGAGRAFAFLSKPFRTEDVDRILEAALDSGTG